MNFIIHLVIYPFDVMVSVDETDAQLVKKLYRFGYKKEDIESLLHMPYSTRGRCEILPGNQVVIRFKKQPKLAEQVGVIAHEVFHAVTFILERINIPLDLNTSDEAYAYLIGYLTEEIYRKMVYQFK